MIKMKIASGLSIALLILGSRITLYGQCNPLPKADFRAYDVCESDSVTFINLSENAVTYLWKFGDGQTSIKQSPKHHYNIGGISKSFNVALIILHPNGCSDSIYSPVTVNVYPKSDFNFKISGNKIDFTPIQSGNTKYRWLFGDGDSSINYLASHTYSENINNLNSQTICLKVTNAANCSSETCHIVPTPIGVFDLNKTTSFKIYPNPNSGTFTIEKVEIDGILSLEIFNQIGQFIYKAELTDYFKTIDLNLANGIYSIRFTNGENRLNQRVVVSK